MRVLDGKRCVCSAHCINTDLACYIFKGSRFPSLVMRISSSMSGLGGNDFYSGARSRRSNY